MIYSIGVSTLQYDPDGMKFVRQDILEEEKNFKYARRCSRVATLDGKAIVVDMGYSPSDLTYRVKTKDDLFDWFFYLCKTYSSIRISTRAGAFKGTPARCKFENGYSFLEILITEEI